MYHTLQDLYSDDFDTYTDSDTDDDVIQTNECTSKQPISARQLSGGKKPCLPYVLPRQQRRSRFHVFDAAKISPLMKNKSLQPTKKLSAAVSSDLQQKSLLPQRRKKEPNSIKTPIEKRTSGLAFTTQKKKANETNTLLSDVNRTEISPIVNRSQDEDDHDGLISFQFKPKFSIPRRRYFGRRHPLTQCIDKNDRLPGKFINVQAILLVLQPHLPALMVQVTLMIVMLIKMSNHQRNQWPLRMFQNVPP